eukprot:gnl/TRDRNA2_/TRDRNA2_169169_c1_seq5.p1 gnl/TRDRNA2_/TRDRNA2_169169_c1~~gnl/TRDRNA2_/TRDRNA2_169169_c1_seq5.p1  ORF type:complete len:208 (+),score=29.30 gnl/TRDRNA2_/TRDRNA2_169169_c1_seq5:39-626(+)
MADDNGKSAPATAAPVQIVGQPVEITGAPVVGTVSALEEKPCTLVCCCGDTVLGFEIFFVIFGMLESMMEMMVAADGGANMSFIRILRLVPALALIAAVIALVAIFIEKPIPRGCGCIPSCATATTGCSSCPCVPWSVGILGVVTLLLAIPDLFFLEEAGDMIFVIITMLQKILTITVGFLWLFRYTKQGYRCCC